MIKLGGFAGSLWESYTNMEVALLENDIIKPRNTSIFTRIATYNDLERVQETAKTKKIQKVCEAALHTYTIKHVFPLNQFY